MERVEVEKQQPCTHKNYIIDLTNDIPLLVNWRKLKFEDMTIVDSAWFDFSPNYDTSFCAPLYKSMITLLKPLFESCRVIHTKGDVGYRT